MPSYIAGYPMSRNHIILSPPRYWGMEPRKLDLAPNKKRLLKW